MHITVSIKVQGFDDDGTSLAVQHKETHNIELSQRTGDVADLLVDAVRNQIYEWIETEQEKEDAKRKEKRSAKA